MSTSEPSTMRVALVSMKHQPGDVAGNLDRHRLWIARALEHRPDFIGFPEFSLTGWVYDRSQMLGLRHPALREIRDLARAHGVAIATGFVEKRGTRAFNACLVAGPDGRTGVMRKVNLVGKEGEHYTPGRAFPVFDIGVCRLGVTTCADATRFEMMHLLSLRGAEVIFAPHANTLGIYGNCRDGWRHWRMERWPLFARDTCVCIAGVNCAGLSARGPAGEEPSAYCGGGMAMDWTGTPLARLAGKNKREGLLVADFDLAGLRAARAGHTMSSEFRPHIVYNRRNGWVRGRCD